MRIGVLGPLAIDGDVAALGRRDRVVLAALVVRSGEVVNTEAIADALWGDEVPASSHKILQGCVMRLRRVLGAEAIETSPRGYRLLVSDEVDAHELERLTDRAHELLRLGEPDRAAYLARKARSLWRGPPLREVEGWEPGRSEAERLEQLRLDVEELAVEAGLHAGRYRQVLAEAHARVVEAPLRERRWALLAHAQYQAGRQGDALGTLRQARRVMSDELGLDPGPDLVALEEAILRQDPALVALHVPEAASACPYLGLVPYGVDDAEGFFGREAEIAECLARLGQSGVLVVVGPSGSGKSSLVRAGVTPALRREGYEVVVVTPGAHPMEPLSALRIIRRGGTPVLVVDQAEEAVTLCRDDAERADFFAALAGHAERTLLIVALRADRLGEVSAHPAFARLVERGLYLLKRMSAEQLREVIEAPARQAGLLLEPGLVELLVRDVEGEPGSLPLLSHALRQTWERREGSTLSVAGYQSSGGIRGAVGQTAEAVFAQAAEEQQVVLRDLMLRLVSLSPDGEPVRARVPRRLLATEDHERIIEVLVAARLVTSDEDVVEIAHEALARAWPRLQGWLVDDVEGQHVWRHLVSSADSWEAMGRADSELYRGLRLARATEWRDRSGATLTPVESEFLATSEAAHRSEIERAEAEARRAEQEAERAEADAARLAGLNQRLKAMVAGAAVLALLGGGAGAVAWEQSQRAERQAATAKQEADRAEGQALVARSHELAASAIGVMDEDPSLALLLAVAAASVSEPNRQTDAALHRAISGESSVGRLTSVDVGAGWPALHPEGHRMAVAGLASYDPAPRLDVLDLETSNPLWTFEPSKTPGAEGAFVERPVYSADGEHLAAGVIWHPTHWMRIGPEWEGQDAPPADLLGAHIFDAETGELLERYDLGRCGGAVVGMSPTHLLVRTLNPGSAADDLAGDPETRLLECRWGESYWSTELLDRASGLRQRLASHSWGHHGAMSEDGRRVAVGDLDTATVVVLDPHTGDEVLRLTEANEELAEVQPPWMVKDLSHDGSLLLLGDDPVQVWDVDRGELLSTLPGRNSLSTYGSFSPDGRWVFTTANDGVLRQWNARTGLESRAIPGAGNGPVSLSDGGLLAVAQAESGAVALVDTSLHGEVAAFATCPGFNGAGTIRARDGLVVFATDCDGADSIGYVWEVGSGPTARVVEGFVSQDLELSPDGTQFVMQTGVGNPREAPFTVSGLSVRDVGTGEEVARLSGVCTTQSHVDGPDLSMCSDFPEPPFLFFNRAIQWSPDGAMIAAASSDGKVVVWDAVTGAMLFADSTPGMARDLLFTPDSGELLVSSANSQIVRISTQTWEVDEVDLGAVDGSWALGLLGYIDGGRTLLAGGRFRVQETGASLHWLEADTLRPVRAKLNIHDSRVAAAAMHPTGSRLATGGDDGLVRIWDTATAEMVHEVPIGHGPLQGVAWVAEHHLAVTPRDGNLLVVTTDSAELLHIAQAALTRGFTAAECERFGFDDHCPVLAELRGLAAGEQVALAGTYRLSWETEELHEVLVAGFEASTGTTLDDPSIEELEIWAQDLAADLTLELADTGRYAVTRPDQQDPVCVGSYTVIGERAYFGVERGYWCEPQPYRYFEADFTLDDDELRFAADGFRGWVGERYVWTTKPLHRTD
jgi:DNA-binding SARP family transcriptional activator/WD40 repeat protein